MSFLFAFGNKVIIICSINIEINSVLTLGTQCNNLMEQFPLPFVLFENHSIDTTFCNAQYFAVMRQH